MPVTQSRSGTFCGVGLRSHSVGGCEEFQAIFEFLMRITGGIALHGPEIDSFRDHRIGMAFAVAAFAGKGRNANPRLDAARISYPEFYEIVEQADRALRIS